jgi:serine/threonine protein kinase
MPSENAPGTTTAEPLGRLGRFQLVRHLATGGMAEIYLASASGLAGFRTTVVLKRILPSLATNRQFTQMFLDEARIAATLQHPNIAQVYEVSEEAGSYYFAMEFVPGTDMRQVLRAGYKMQRALPLSHALAVVIDVTCALHYAHEKVGYDGHALGIVHRDVSPANVLVSFEGAVKLVDFGIAKAAWRTSETRAGQLKGKFAYMSPEQARGEEIDRRSDIFSAGILLYELTTRRKLFVGNNELAVLSQVQRCDHPPPSAKVPGYPPELERIVMRALKPRPADRYQTAQDLQLELEELAARGGLVVSQSEIGQYLREVFGLTDPGWRESLEAGVALAELARGVAPPGASGEPGSHDSGAQDFISAPPSPPAAAPPSPSPSPSPSPPEPPPEATIGLNLADLEEDPDATTLARTMPTASVAAPEVSITRVPEASITKVPETSVTRAREVSVTRPAEPRRPGPVFVGAVLPLAPAPPGPAAPAAASMDEPDLTTLDVRPPWHAVAPGAAEATVQAAPAWTDSDRTVQSAPADLARVPARSGALSGQRGADAPSATDGPTSVEIHLEPTPAPAPAPPAPAAAPQLFGPVYAIPPAPVSGWRSWRPLLVGLLIGAVLATILVIVLTRVLAPSAPVPGPAPTTQSPEGAPPR